VVEAEVVVEGMHPRVEVVAGVAALVTELETGVADMEATVVAAAVGGEMPADASKCFAYESSHLLLRLSSPSNQQPETENRKSIKTQKKLPADCFPSLPSMLAALMPSGPIVRQLMTYIYSRLKRLQTLNSAFLDSTISTYI